MSLKKINPIKTKSWIKLKAHFNEIENKEIKDLLSIRSNPSCFSLEWNDFNIDISKNRIDNTTLNLLLDLAKECGLEDAISKQFKGDIINDTEKRAVLHTAVRTDGNEKINVDGLDVVPSILETRSKIKSFTNDVMSGNLKGDTGKPFTDVVNIGIGGSDLGPVMVVEALKHYSSRLKPHFVSNVDGDHVLEIIKDLNPETTLFIIVSKTFTTQETISNANTIRDWLVSKLNVSAVSKHFAAVSTNLTEIKKFGINPKMVFSMNDWVGGRFSLWSSVGLSISLAVGYENFSKLLEYHIGNCLGGCEGHQKEKDYNIYISNIRDFLKGNLSSSINYFKNEMEIASDSLKFEKAQKAKEKIELLENYQSKSTVVSSKLNNIDVFSIISDSSHAYVNHLQVAFGRIVRFHNVEIKKKLDETDKELLLMTLVNLRDKFSSKNNTIISNIEFDKILNLKFIYPKAGDNKKLLDLSVRNATQFKIEKLKQVQIVDPERHTNRILNQMKIDLRLNEIPIHIECFDNSNIQGSNPVASCIVFKNSKPSKKDYRHFNIKTVEGPDDYASMEEVVYRRYKRMVDEKSVLPSLIIIDGGKGQLSSSIKALKKLNLENTIAILGIAKRLEEIFYPNDPIPLYLNKKSETLKVIQQMRNEAHRFAITFHRNKRSKQALTSSFDGIPGIGEKTKTTLLKRFKSLKKIKETSLDLLINEVGESKAKKIKEFLNSMK